MQLMRASQRHCQTQPHNFVNKLLLSSYSLDQVSFPRLTLDDPSSILSKYLSKASLMKYLQQRTVSLVTAPSTVIHAVVRRWEICTEIKSN
jgi:hypothetical protein